MKDNKQKMKILNNSYNSVTVNWKNRVFAILN